MEERRTYIIQFPTEFASDFARKDTLGECSKDGPLNDILRGMGDNLIQGECKKC